MLSEHETLVCAFCGESRALLEIDCNGEELQLMSAEGWSAEGWCWHVLTVGRRVTVSAYCPDCTKCTAATEAKTNAVLSDTDARALLDKLELTRLKGDGHILRDDPNRPPTLNEIHRVFHYVVCRWLQEQGADVVGR